LHAEWDWHVVRRLLNEHDTAAQPKERNDTEEMKLMIQRNQIMIETVLLRMEQLRIQLAVPKQQAVSLSWNVFFVFWLFIPFCASFFPSCSFWDLAGIAFAKELSAFDSSVLLGSLLLLVVLLLPVLSFSMVPKPQDLPRTRETNVSSLIDKQANNQLVNDNNLLRAYFFSHFFPWVVLQYHVR
jgi:hypothetical protein